MKPTPSAFSLLIAAAIAGQAIFAPRIVAQIATEPSAPPQSVRAIAPVYPLELLLQKKSGSAEVRFTVDSSGRPLFVSATGSEPAFARALLADIESNEFMPPRVNGKPQTVTARFRYPFNGEAGLDPLARQILEELRKPAPSIVSVDQLDKRPTPIRRDAPTYPASLQSDGLSGKAEIEVVIDRNGRVLFPRIASASHEDCGWAAAVAVTRWKFQPPTKDGKPVDVRMTIPVNFDHTKMVATF